MKNNTNIDYKEAVKAKFEKEKVGEFHAYLENPTPANLRDLCLLKFDNELNRIDKEIFRIYFKVKENEDIRTTIYNYRLSELKSIQKFLNESKKHKNTSTSILNLNLLAVLVGFEPRPYNKFSRQEGFQMDGSENGERQEEEFTPVQDDDFIDNDETTDIKEPETVIDKEEKPAPTSNFLVADNSNATENNPSSTETKKQTYSNWKRKIGIGLGSIATVYLGYSTFFPKEQCMKWCEDHYELVNCINDAQGLGSYEIIKPYDEREFARKELIVCDTTDFFVGENLKNPKVWYSKENNIVQFFNMNGVNPENGAHLKPITPHMIKEHVNSD